jgi:hypothetical protein
MFDLRRNIEGTLRNRVSEHVLLQVHDGVYAPVRGALDPINDAVESALLEAFGPPSVPDRFRTSLIELRAMLDANAKERDLQRVLVESGLLDPAGACRAVAEVAMAARSGDPRGMRMDLVLGATVDEPAQVIELKRGSHRLLARRGTPTESISNALAKALRQVRSYGDRLESDAETRW